MRVQGPLVAAPERGEAYTALTLLSDRPHGAPADSPAVVNAFVATGVPGRMHGYVAVSVLPALPLPDWGLGDPVADTDGAAPPPRIRMHAAVSKVNLKPHRCRCATHGMCLSL